MALAIGIFVDYRLIPVNQSFGPEELSSLGGANPIQVNFGVECVSQDGSYISEVSNVGCTLTAKAINYHGNYLNLTTWFVKGNNQTVICNAVFNDINTAHSTSANCLDPQGNRFFELASGNYTITLHQFNQGGVIVTKAIGPTFRGQLYVMTAFERQLRISDDGTSLATFFAFIFLIPATLLQIRSFSRESKNR